MKVIDDDAELNEIVSFEDWYRASYGQLHACLHAATGSSEAASDVLQDALVAALEEWEAVRTMDSPQGWVYTVALNAHRRRQRRRKALERLLPKLWVRTEGETSLPTSEVWDAVTNLDDREREVVALRYLADLTEPEISRITGGTRGSVSATLRSAHTKLRPRLRIQDDIPPVERKLLP